MDAKPVWKQSFFKKIFLSLVAVTVFITLCLTSFLLLLYRTHSYNLVERFYSRVLTQANYSVTYINDLATRLSRSLYADGNVIAFLNSAQIDNMATIVASTAVRKIILPLTYVESVYLYNAKTDLLLSTRNGEQLALGDFYDTDLAQALQNPDLLLENKGRPLVHTVTYQGKPLEICSYVLYETDARGEQMENALVINIPTGVLTNSLEELTGGSTKNGVFMMADETGRVLGSPAFYSTENNKQALDAVIARYQSGETSALFTVEVDGTSYLTMYSADNPNRWLLVGMLDKAALLSDLVRTMVFSVALALLLLAGAALLCLHLTKRLHSPVQAITHMVKGQLAAVHASAEAAAPRQAAQKQKTPAQPLPQDEFAYLSGAFATMQEQNLQFERFVQDARYTLRQDFLTALILGRNVYSMEKTKQLMQELNITYITEHPLCLCILKIDDYAHVFFDKNQNEAWALRYAVVNIASELLQKPFACEVANTHPDKFVALLDCAAFADYPAFQTALHPALERVNKAVSGALGFSLTIAYSSWFQGVERLPLICEITAELAQRKLRYGAGRVISPQMLEDADTEPQEISPAEEERLREAVFAGNATEAQACLTALAQKLYTQSYDEVIPYTVHLTYVLYHGVCGKYPLLRQTLADEFRACVTQLSDCELLADISARLAQFVSLIIEQLEETRAKADTQGSGLIVARALEIIGREIANQSLCLNSIAEEIGLSANYIGTLFKSAQGVSVAKYIQDTRMEQVAHYLKTTKYPLAKILDCVGLEMNNYFYTSFKKYFGMSMGKYKLTVLGQTEETE